MTDEVLDALDAIDTALRKGIIAAFDALAEISAARQRLKRLANGGKEQEE